METRNQSASFAHEVTSTRDVPWRIIAFDLDDTLYPEAQFVRSGFREIAIWMGENFGLNADTTFSELTGLFDKGVRGTIFDLWLVSRGLPSTIVDEMVKIYRAHFPSIAPFPGVREMLSDLRTEFSLGLLSDGPHAVQERKLAALGISHQFDAIVFSDTWGRDAWKPSTIPFIALMKALNATPAEAVYIGDNPLKDFIACRRLGMQSIWFRKSGGIYSEHNPESEGCAPDYIVESIEDIATLLKTGRAT